MRKLQIESQYDIQRREIVVRDAETREVLRRFDDQQINLEPYEHGVRDEMAKLQNVKEPDSLTESRLWC